MTTGNPAPNRTNLVLGRESGPGFVGASIIRVAVLHFHVGRELNDLTIFEFLHGGTKGELTREKSSSGGHVSGVVLFRLGCLAGEGGLMGFNVVEGMGWRGWA